MLDGRGAKVTQPNDDASSLRQSARAPGKQGRETISPRSMRMKFSVHTIGEREQAASSSVDTDIPARLDRLPWGRFHTLVVVALGITWILDGLEVTLAGAVAGALKAEPGASFQQYRYRARRQRLYCRRGLGRAVLRLADRPAGPQEAVLHHPRRLPARHRGHRAVVEYLELRRVPLPDRGGHRRRIRRHQLDDPGARSRRACAGGPISPSTAASGSARRWAQPGRSCCSIRPSSIRNTDGGLRSCIGAALGVGDLLHAAVDPGKSALADDARARGGGARA